MRTHLWVARMTPVVIAVVVALHVISHANDATEWIQPRLNRTCFRLQRFLDAVIRENARRLDSR
jgi:hypothetical protein